jgi:hypothetical protein
LRLFVSTTRIGVTVTFVEYGPTLSAFFKKANCHDEPNDLCAWFDMTARQLRAINRARVREHRDRKNNGAVRLTIMVRPQHIEAGPMSALGH